MTYYFDPNNLANLDVSSPEKLRQWIEGIVQERDRLRLLVGAFESRRLVCVAGLPKPHWDARYSLRDQDGVGARYFETLEDVINVLEEELEA